VVASSPFNLPGRSHEVGAPIISACLLMASAMPAAWANGGGPEITTPREQTPQEQAKTLYNQGVHDVKKADES